jgi:cation/acetate symporter
MARLLPPERDFGVLDTPLGSIFLLAGAFVLVLLAFALVERIGFQGGFVSVGVIAAALALGAFAALLSHGRRAVDYYVGERRVTGAFGGLAAASAFAGILAIGLVGGAYASRLEFLASAIGLALGFLLLASIGAPALRRLAVYTVGDFLALRFGGIWVRLTGAAVAFAASFFLLMAHLKAASALLATLTDLEPRNALLCAAALTALPALAGGMRSLTWTQAVQYFVVLLACLAPAAYLSAQDGGLPEGFGLLLGNLPAWGSETLGRYAIPVLFMMLGAASLPHLMARALAAKSGREAAASLVWGTLFALALVMVALVFWRVISGAEGIPVEAGGGDFLQLAALFATLPAFMAGLVAAGTLAALFSLGQAALFSAATSIAHDLFEIIDPSGPETLRIVLARIIVVIVAAAAAALLPLWRIDAPALLRWALAFAAAGGLAPLLLGLRWSRCNDVGALAGTIAGFGFTIVAFLAERGVLGDAGGLARIGAPIAAIAGVSAAFAVSIGVSLILREPSRGSGGPATAMSTSPLPAGQHPD